MQGRDHGERPEDFARLLCLARPTWEHLFGSLGLELWLAEHMSHTYTP
jgi:hypothetical protein